MSSSNILSDSIDTFMVFCIVASGTILIGSFAFVCFSPRYRLNAPLVVIYVLEILSISFAVAHRLTVRWQYDRFL